VWAGLVLALAAAYSQETPFPETDKAEQALKELERLPVAVEYRQLQGEIDAIRKEEAGKLDPLKVPFQERLAPLEERLEKLCASPAFREYSSTRWELSQEGRTAAADRKAMAAAAKALYGARHAEIRGLAQADLPGARALGFDALTYPRVDGSTSSWPLSVILACRVLDIPYEWFYPDPVGVPWQRGPDVSAYVLLASALASDEPGAERGDVEFSLATLRVVAAPARPEQRRIALLINSYLAASTSTHGAYANVIEGRSDLSLSIRAPSASELDLATKKGVALKLEPIARDALVFIVNRHNPVTGLTREQVRAVYEGKVADWQALGGNKGGIKALRRERDSGSRELFDALVMQGQPLPEGKGFAELYTGSMAGPYNRVTGIAGAVGYSVYYYEHFMAASPFTRVVAIDGVEPTAATIAAGTYPWVTPVHAVYRDGEPADSPGMRLLRWLTTAEGQAVVRESGYVPMR